MRFGLRAKRRHDGREFIVLLTEAARLTIAAHQLDVIGETCKRVHDAARQPALGSAKKDKKSIININKHQQAHPFRQIHAGPGH